MKFALTGISALAALAFGATTANAQTLTFESVLGSPTLVGGVGPIGGAHWTQSSTIVNAAGETSTSTSECVGMGQPSGSVYDRHVTCSIKGAGGDIAVVMGCFKGAEGSGEMSCTGYVEGKSGEAEGHRGMITQHYKFNTDGSGGTSTGTGQWTS